MKPLVSVVMTAYNEETTVANTMASVLDQTYGNLELVAVDDGSTDSTGAIMAQHAAKDPRVHHVTSPANVGLARAANLGIETMKGEWYARIDAGDRWYPRKLEKQMKYVAAHADIGLVGTWAIHHNVVTGVERVARTPQSDEAIKQALWQMRCPFIHSTIILRRRLLDEFGPYNPVYPYAIDLDLYFRMVVRTKAHNISEPLCRRPTHDEHAVSTRHWKQQLRCALAIRWRNARSHRRPWRTYLRLVPPVFKLCLPGGAKRWKQHAIRLLTHKPGPNR
jgi:glycosyltransferase involved in cell wall biosynthesis